jgi:hypothetical protein
MKASLMTRLEHLEKASPIVDESKRIDRIVLVGIGADLKPTCESVLWTRPGFVDDATLVENCK